MPKTQEQILAQVDAVYEEALDSVVQAGGGNKSINLEDLLGKICRMRCMTELKEWILKEEDD